MASPNVLEPRTIWDIPATPACVCCAGRLTEADPVVPASMCEGCLRDVVQLDVCEHMLRFTDEDLLRSLPSASVTIRVNLTSHALGQAWHWLDEIKAFRAACPACRPCGPCWRHEKVSTILHGHSGVLAPEVCESLSHLDVPGCRPIAGVLVDGPTRRKMCHGCALVYLGPATAEAEAVTRG